jgi:hypothetical protein
MVRHNNEPSAVSYQPSTMNYQPFAFENLRTLMAHR